MDSSPLPAPTSPSTNRRWVLIRELVVFAAKAAIEALRDIVLIPLAFIAGAIGLLSGRDDPERPFHAMLRRGRRFDRWLNLFGALEEGEAGRPAQTVDGFFERVEAIVVEQHARGGITAGAKDAIDRTLDRIARGRATHPQRGKTENDA